MGVKSFIFRAALLRFWPLVLSNDFSDKMHIWNGTELYIQESEHLWNKNKALASMYLNFFPN